MSDDADDAPRPEAPHGGAAWTSPGQGAPASSGEGAPASAADAARRGDRVGHGGWARVQDAWPADPTPEGAVTANWTPEDA
ncbi:hypothetical protein B1C81_20880, partial [Streptomyces sp. HG99]